MEPETPTPRPEALSAQSTSASLFAAGTPPGPSFNAAKPPALFWVFLGEQGLRAGWSVLLFALLSFLFGAAMQMALSHFYPASLRHSFTAQSAFFSELLALAAVAAAASVVAFIEGRKNLLAFNLTGRRRIPHFFSGLAAGFATLSALVGVLCWGGWLHFGAATLSGAEILRFGLMWAAAFLLVGCMEEGIFRCYLQFTLTRGLNFWWALGIISLICLRLLYKGIYLGGGSNLWGVYAIALLGLVPCLLLHLKKVPGNSFWQAAWITSTIFGMVHTSNGGENWIGIFAAGLIGFVFCVSVRLTGSAWWAIGCHAAWDWAETFFYGTADSGMQPQGHFLSASPAGNALWSGGEAGPEGSLIVIGIILLLLAALLALYGRRTPVPVKEQNA